MTNRPDFPKVDVSGLNVQHLEILKTAKKLLAKTEDAVGNKDGAAENYERYICFAVDAATTDEKLRDEITDRIHEALFNDEGYPFERDEGSPAFEDCLLGQWSEGHEIDIQVLRHEWLDIIIKELENELE